MKKISFDIRLASIDDAAMLSLFVNAAYRGESSKKGWTTEADILGGQRTDPNSMTTKIQDHRNAVLLFFREQILVACVALEKKDHIAMLGMLTVSPTMQAAGIGRQVVDYAEGWATTQWHSNEMEMNVISCRSELIAWYERRGYNKTGLTEPFPYGDERFGLPKVPNLEFINLSKKLQK